jgi:Domain of unknown function (DUF4136)
MSSTGANMTIKNSVLTILFMTTALASRPLAGQAIHSQVDRLAAFATYRTYSWDGDADDSQDGRALRDAMNKNLGLFGWRMVPSGGDVRVTATIAARKKQRVSNSGFAPYYSVISPTGYAAVETTSETTKSKELALSFVDARSGSLIWAADTRWQSSRAANDPRRDLEDKKVEQVVGKAFRKLAQARRDLPVS